MPTQAELALDQLTAQQDAEQLAAEQAASLQASKQVQVEIAAIMAAVLLLGDGESDHGRQLLAALAQRLVGLPFDPLPALERAGVTGLDLGQQHALEQLEAVRRHRQGSSPKAQVEGYLSVPRDVSQLSDAVRAVIDGTEFRARIHLAIAAELLTGSTGQAQRLAALGVARRAVTEIERAAAFAVVRSAADAVTATAVDQGASRLWVGERDACLHCLAYFGHIADGTDPFPAQLTFARQPLSGALGGPVENPPLHPHCRCRIIVWRRSWADTSGTSYPAALKREAHRSVLRGWSLESESAAARLDAADRLLHRAAGSSMPKSVQSYAEQAVRRGVFPRGRTVPGSGASPVRAR